jgi:hypothetical protein
MSRNLKPQDFHKAIAQLLTEKLKPLVSAEKQLNLVTCVEIYTTIFDTMVEVITEAELPLTNESANYLAQQYYDGILINGVQELDPDIFTQRAKLSGIATEDLTLLAVMLNGTDFAVPIVAEVKRRS